MTRKRDKTPVSAPTWTDVQGKVWLVLGEGAIIDKAVEAFLAVFDDGEAVENMYGWCIRADSLERDGYMHLRIGVHVDRI